MKYIDADKLIAEIERRMEMHRKASASGYIIDPNRLDEDEDILSLIDSLQQEQPDLPSVDLEKVALHVYESWMGGTMDDVRRDMVELGKVLNARKEG